MSDRVHCDVNQLLAMITQIGERAVRGVAAAMTEEAHFMAEVAKSYAPVDEGNIERAIKVETDRLGTNTRKRVSIIVDSDVASESGKLVGAYATLIHEGLAPYGSGFYQLGEKSIRKMQAGNNVGGKFLERAVYENMPDLIRRVNEMAARAAR